MADTSAYNIKWTRHLKNQNPLITNARCALNEQSLWILQKKPPCSSRPFALQMFVLRSMQFKRYTCVRFTTYIVHTIVCCRDHFLYQSEMAAWFSFLGWKALANLSQWLVALDCFLLKVEICFCHRKIFSRFIGGKV